MPIDPEPTGCSKGIQTGLAVVLPSGFVAQSCCCCLSFAVCPGAFAWAIYFVSAVSIHTWSFSYGMPTRQWHLQVQVPTLLVTISLCTSLNVTMPCLENRDANFMYGRQGQSKKKSRRSIWPCKPTHQKSERKSHETNNTSPSEWNTTRNTTTTTTTTTSKPNTHSPRQRPPTQKQMDGRRTAPAMNRFGPRPNQPLEDPSSSPSRSFVSDYPPFTMHPFSRLASTVRQCPWMLGSDMHPTAATAAATSNHHGTELYYPPVPRSLMHDTAVSFVVTDFTRPEQPNFVLSCPLEHVDFIQKMLAPEGSQRVLSARGSSGHPRGGEQLRSMLLDGTPNIELALYGSGSSSSGSGATIETASAGERGGPPPGVIGSGAFACRPEYPPFVGEPPAPYGGGGGGGGNPQGYGGPPPGWMGPMSWVPVPPGWHPSPQAPPAANPDGGPPRMPQSSSPASATPPPAAAFEPGQWN